MKFLKAHAGMLLAVLLILLAAGGWLLLWNRIGGTVKTAELDAAFESFTYSGAYYRQCTLTELADYGEIRAVDASLCGESCGSLTVSGMACPLYACTLFPDAEVQPLLILQRGSSYLAYELTGFASLGEHPSMPEVLDAYGAAVPDALESVTVREANGTLIDRITDASDLREFQRKLSALGADLSEAEQMQAYYDAYKARYGEDSGIALTEGSLMPADSAAYEQAMTLWGEGMCLVTVQMKNGLLLRDAVYAPVPALFAVYGCYALTEPFFS